MKITDIEVNESIELGDNFDIELGNTIIESRVVGFMDDGVILEADDKALALLGISGALLESVDITEVSLGDYSKKAQISRALAQIDQKFYPDKPGSEQTIAKRTRGLERAKVRNDQAKAKYAAQARQARAKAIAKDRENLPTLEKYLAQLQSEFDPYYEYSDDHSVWTRNRELKAKISDLERRIKDAKNITESKSFGPENPYEVKPGEDFSLVFKPGKQSGVHYHMNSGMIADPFYFVLNGKLYSVTNQGDGIPKEVQQGVAGGTNPNDLSGYVYDSKNRYLGQWNGQRLVIDPAVWQKWKNENGQDWASGMVGMAKDRIAAGVWKVQQEKQGVAEGFLGDREYNRVMPFVKRIASEVSDYDRDEFGEELWSLLDQKYGSKFAQSVLDDLDFYWDTYTELTGQQGVAEGSIYKKDQDLSSIPTQELEAFVKKHWGGGVPTYSQGKSVQRAMRELRRRQKQGVAEEQVEESTPDALAKINDLFRK